MHTRQVKQSRVRHKQIKKWTVAEEKALLEFLLNNREMEKPNPQLFYRRFCYENNFNIQWKTVRSKVKNMRYIYRRARAFESETSSFADNDESKTSMLKKCKYYYELEQIFGHQIMQLPTLKEENLHSLPTSNLADSIVIGSENTIEKSDDDNLPNTSKSFVPEMIEINPDLNNSNHYHMDSDFSMKCNELGVNVTQLRLKDKIKVMKLVLKEKELNSTEKLKLHEINSQEELKIRELEMKERLVKEALRLKYK